MDEHVAMKDRSPFQISIDYEDGVVIEIIHKGTGLRIVGCPRADETVARAEHRLCEQLYAGIFKPDDYIFSTGRCQVDGKIGSFYAVTHKPTGTSRVRDSIRSVLGHHTRSELVEEVLRELWTEGLLAPESVPSSD